MASSLRSFATIWMMDWLFQTPFVLRHSWRIEVFNFSDILPLDEWLNHVVVSWCLISYWFKLGLSRIWGCLFFWSHEEGPCWAHFCNPVPTPEQTLGKFLLNLRDNRFKLLLNRLLYPFSWLPANKFHGNELYRFCEIRFHSGKKQNSGIRPMNKSPFA